MHPSWRKVTVLCWGVATAFALHGCSSRLGSVRATQSAGGMGRPNLPDTSVERAKECVAEYGQQMAPGRVVLHSTVEVDEDGYKVGVTVDGIPDTAPDLGACMRIVLRDMPIAEEPFYDAVKTLEFHRAHAIDGQEALNRFIEVLPGVPIVDSELELEAEGYTVVLPVTVKVVARLKTLIDGDKRILAKLGQLAIESLGYEGIMERAEQLGWVKRVPIKNAQSAADTRFISDMPPATGAIVEAAFKRVMTKAAPVALTVSQADSPAPGPADLVAVGIFAIGLVAAGGIVVYELVTASTTGTTTAALPIPTATPPAPPVPAPRRYPNQTCENDELDRLEKEKKKVCKPDGGFATNCPKNPLKKKEFADIPCSLIKLALQQRQACKAARWDVENKCFGGKPDPGHQTSIDQEQNAIENCEAFILVNCAKGHPMAGK